MFNNNNNKKTRNYHETLCKETTKISVGCSPLESHPWASFVVLHSLPLISCTDCWRVHAQVEKKKKKAPSNHLPGKRTIPCKFKDAFMGPLILGSELPYVSTVSLQGEGPYLHGDFTPLSVSWLERNLSLGQGSK